MRNLIVFFLVLSGLFSFAQETAPTVVLDSLYREDQFYFNFSYASLSNTPDDFRQTKFSPRFAIGLFRDMPINKSRTVAIALGLGYSFVAYNQNLQITKTELGSSYALLKDATSFSKNKLSLHNVDLPIEFRWRSSTPDTHKFWRIYTGLQLSYLVYDQYKIQSDLNNYKIKNNEGLNKFSYGAYLSAGRNTWNAYFYYGFTPLFDSSVTLENQTNKMNAVNFGLMFYIL